MYGALASYLGGGGGAAAGGAAGGGWTSLIGPLLSQIGKKQSQDPNDPGATGPQPATNSTGASLIGNTMIASDKIGQALTEPEAARRAYVLDLAGDAPQLGAGIQPVASSRGGAAMARAMEENRAQRQNEYARDEYMKLGQKIRRTKAIGSTVGNSVGILASIAMMLAGGGGAGGAGGGAGATAGAGGMSGI